MASMVAERIHYTTSFAVEAACGQETILSSVLGCGAMKTALSGGWQRPPFIPHRGVGEKNASGKNIGGGGHCRVPEMLLQAFLRVMRQSMGSGRLPAAPQ